MGLLSKLFGGNKDYPPLPENNEGHAILNELRDPLEDLAHKVSERIEVVPAGHEAFVFLGKPPKNFGIAWIHDGKVSGLKELMENHNLSQGAATKMIDKLGQAYAHASETPRYSAEVGGKKAVVITSKNLEQEVREIINSTIH